MTENDTYRIRPRLHRLLYAQDVKHISEGDRLRIEANIAALEEAVTKALQVKASTQTPNQERSARMTIPRPSRANT